MAQRTRIRFLRQFTLGVLSFVLILVGVACSDSPPAPPATHNDTVLQVVTSPSFPPFEWEASDGSLGGFDIDLMKAIATTAGFEVSFQSVSLFDDIIRQLYAGTADLAISAMTITPERAAVVSFSRPYFKAGLAIAVAANDNTITEWSGLQGKRIGVQAGTTGATKAREIPNGRVVGFDTIAIALQELTDGQVDAVLNDAAVTDFLINSGTVQGVKRLDSLLNEEFYGMAAPQNSPHLDAINTALGTLLENGQYQDIYQQWFGTVPPALPETVLD